MGIVIYGYGQYANMIKYLLKKEMGIDVLAFCVDDKYIKKTIQDGVPIIPFSKIDNIPPPKKFKMFVAVGYSVMRNRKIMFDNAISKGYEFINLISKHSSIDENIKIGRNNIILQGSQIEPFVEIGDNNIIWSSTNLCHDVKIGHHNFIASKSLIGGNTTIENNCFLGFNSTITNGLTIKNKTLIGAGSLVLHNTDEASKYISTPAIKVGTHFESGIIIE
ncbi:acetyltransferase [Vibrio cortegadensis]|uniref:Acetyltransferase n=1 Tax=Vibrio cortegadensis TaxID=1328770 RepID=A0ABV4M728_9VIBR